MDEKENKRPGDSGNNDDQWKQDAKTAGEDAGRHAALQGELDAQKVADAGQKAGSDAAWKAGGDSYQGGDIGKTSAIDQWSSDIKTQPQTDSRYALEHKYGKSDE